MKSKAVVDMWSIAEAQGVVGGLRPQRALRRLHELEPYLARFIEKEAQQIFGILGRQGVSAEAQAVLKKQILALPLLVMEGYKRSIFAWTEGTEIGRLLLKSDPTLGDFDLLADYLDQCRAEESRTEIGKAGAL